MAETPRYNEGTNANNPAGKTENFVSKHFVRLLVWLAVSGGSLAIFGPWLLYAAGLTGETDANLRLHILYVTGGTIAVLGLVETHHKNTVDHEKAKVEKENYKKTQAHQTSVLEEQQRQFNVTTNQERKKIKADKAKNEQDHIRQVHAERRSRYTTAIEQLSSDKASIRLGGVYSLVGLVDEWLADEKTIRDIKERRKKGQVIINNLCAYIRSPFPLAEQAEQLDGPYAKDLQQDFKGDKEKFDTDKRAFAQEKAALEEECQVRQSIIKEICERLQEFGAPGPWSNFNYDFSSTVFFYPTNFSDSFFGASSIFSGATFTDNVNFSVATFTDYADFNGAKFTDNTHFSWAKFTGSTHFSGATFTDNASFSWAEFTGDADFSQAEFTSADFSGAAFLLDADFSGAAFLLYADFSGAAFLLDADFSEATFTQDADFSETTFIAGYADFSETTFTGYADFSWVIFKYEPIFVYTLGNKTYKARFSYKVNPKNYKFDVSPKSCKIKIEEQEHNGTKFIIPKGTILFDPDELPEQEDNNSNDS